MGFDLFAIIWISWFSIKPKVDILGVKEIIPITPGGSDESLGVTFSGRKIAFRLKYDSIVF